MPGATCEKCGGTTNSSVCDYDWVQKKALQCYAKLTDGVWVKGCAYDQCDAYTRPSVDGLLGKPHPNVTPPVS